MLYNERYKMNEVKSCSLISELLQNINSKLAKIMNKHYAAQNLTAPSISILLLLNNQGAMRVSDIAAALSMVDSNVSAICSRLEKLDMIERIRLKEDQRVVKISLTKTALDKMEDITSSVKAFQESIERSVTEKDLEDIVLGLTKLSKLLDNADVK